MKKLLCTIILTTIAAFSLKAVPACPWPVKYRQPDGSIISIRLHGDEHWHYATTLDGNVVSRSGDGFMRPARKPSLKRNPIQEKSRIRPRLVQMAQESISMGGRRFLVILVDFADVRFTVPSAADAFSSMLNTEGYSQNGATGSAHDYFYENSQGRFNPVFDVIGPVQVRGKMADYGANTSPGEGGTDKNVGGMLEEACRAAASAGLVDFSSYDTDYDGFVDNVFFYFAGCNEAEGGGEDAIWPHAGALHYNDVTLNGVRVWSYACTSEYRGGNPGTMAGIGTFCHEFSHVLGLPDFYDADYEKHGTSPGVYSWSLMSSGNYNNNGRTPPYLGILERWMLGWADMPWWQVAGRVSLDPVHKNSGARTPSSTDGEFFLYEYRDGTGWDSWIRSKNDAEPPSGMLVYHVDMSTTPMEDGLSAWDLWNSNQVNIYQSHPCYRLALPVSSWGDYNDMLRPGTSGAASFEGRDWKGAATGYVLKDIDVSDGKVTAELSVPGTRTIKGFIRNSAAQTIAGATVTISSEGSELASAKSGSDGFYSLRSEGVSMTEFTISVSCEGFRPHSQTIKLSTSEYILDIVLLGIAEPGKGTLNKHGGYGGSNLGITSTHAPWSATLATCFTPSELREYAGWKFGTINFLTNGTGASRVSVFIDFGTSRMLTRDVPSPAFGTMVSVDISDAGLHVPSGEIVYIGYALDSTNEQYWISIDSTTGVQGGGVMRPGYLDTGSKSWQDLGYNLIIDATLDEVMEIPISDLGIKTIANPSRGEPYPLGSIFTLTFEDAAAGNSPLLEKWYFDGKPVSGSVHLNKAGTHTITVILEYPDGREEELEQQIIVR